MDAYFNGGFLLAFTLLLLPLATAQSIGWTPPWLRRQRGPVRLLGAAGLVLYAVVLVNTVPRLAGASADSLAYASYMGTILTFVFAALCIAYGIRAHKDR
jgi:hypothetical protein